MRSVMPCRRAVRAVVASAIVVSIAGCASTRVSRIEPAAVTDLSGRWNDTDSRLVARQLVEQALGDGWSRRYMDLHGGEAPPVMVGTFANRTMEHIPIGTFVNDVEHALVASGAARVVASVAERGALRAERGDQQQNARADSRARPAQELAARYVLVGELQSMEDVEGRERIVFYQIDASLIDLESNAKVWVGQKKIKKYIERARFTI